MSLYMSYQTVMMEKIHSTNWGHVVDVDIGVKPSSDSTAEKDADEYTEYTEKQEAWSSAQTRALLQVVAW